MAGSLKVRTIINCTGLGDEVTIDTGEVTMTVPVEHIEGYTITEGYVTASIQLSELVPQIALAKLYGIYIKAEFETIYVLLNTAGTATFTVTTAHLRILAGQGVWIPLNNGITTPAGMKIMGSSVASAFSWMTVGSA